MLINKEKIENFIPQRSPFVMIDSLLEASEKMFKTEFRILPGNIFLENGIFREFGLIENIAQTSSAGLIFSKLYSVKKNADGYIGGISKLKVYDLPEENDIIHTIVNVMAHLENMFLLKGENYLNSKKLLECELKLAAR